MVFKKQTIKTHAVGSVGLSAFLPDQNLKGGMD